jgi:prevent-host-death family protein
MRYVTLKELRVRTRQILEEAGRGEEIAVTFRGKPVALVVPFEEEGEIRARPYREAWADIEATLARSRPAFPNVDEALKSTRRRP